jgi:drug/metabolite transporter (DMT)-like permease
MFVVLSALAALGYGASDFAGGVAARRIRPTTALLYGEPAGLLVIVLTTDLGGTFSLRTVILSALAGMCGLVGLGLMYRLMASQMLSVVSPVTAVVAAAVPLGFGILAGEHPGPAAWAGVAVGLIAVALMSGARGGAPAAVRLRVALTALGSGGGFGAYFVLIAHAGDGTGTWPLVLSRMFALVVLVPLAMRRRALLVPTASAGLFAIAAGLSDAAADAAFLLATREGSLSLVGVITAFYPAVTVLLAVVLLRERAGWVTCAGVALSGVSIALIAG